MGAGVPRGDSTVMFYGRWRLGRGFLNIRNEGVGYAVFTRDGAPMERRTEWASREGERVYLPLVTDGDTVYLESCNVVGSFDAECRIARSTRAVVAVRGMNGFSLSFNRHLGRWVALYGEILGNRMFLRTAPRPEGCSLVVSWYSPIDEFRGTTRVAQVTLR